ncbi:interphotoreceptor retinoid-binding protein [Actinocatenispora thailandica]|uniref:Interphotoreceptor retinoid-binding protein n=1 Tax=Actinocatenispora thailandica TaxID=227318 RepID=A0A7R7DLC3_9ACTN|nr:S41 family peptidase [Actinocatenispora thailandica]BCJ33733.1 interphotoreceptor retinoid-binding protein [Actinocatenispora thailandica]
MERADIDRIVAEVGKLVATRYVFAELGEQIAADLAATAATGRYATATDEAALAELVTADLQRANGDGHLRLIHHTESIDGAEDGAVAEATYERRARRSMSGIGRIERLDGNIGLLEISPALFAAHLVGDEITAAMRILRHTDALILDLRGCLGSDPGSVAYFLSYLLPPETHLNDVYDRGSDSTTQFWTLPHVPGPRYGTERPVYVLTSRRTFSGGEELAYDLRHNDRATLVGETTGGGAHPRIGVRLGPHLEASIPTCRSINPITGTDWEGTGVPPHLATSAAEALATAHEHARTRLAENPDS